jgi:hypothetical protein
MFIAIFRKPTLSAYDLSDVLWSKELLVIGRLNLVGRLGLIGRLELAVRLGLAVRLKLAVLWCLARRLGLDN